jgi:translocation and assembly module TamB
MTAYPFRPPAAMVRDLKGVFPFDNDSVWWKGAYVALPNSKGTTNGVYQLNSGDLALTLRGDPASFADLRWVYPRLPSNGHGRFDLKVAWKGDLQGYQFTNADVRMGDAHTTGSFGITLDDSITIHDTDLRFTAVDTRILEELIPRFRSPRRGVLAGRAKAHGSRRSLAADGDVTFDDPSAGRSRVAGAGEVGFLDGGGVRARDLRLRLLPLQLAMARTWFPAMPVAGTVTGQVTIDGSTVSQLAIAGSIDHVDRGEYSAMTGRATVRGRSLHDLWFDVDVDTHPISLVTVGRFVPSAGLRGSAAGPVHVTGTTRTVGLHLDLRLPGGGRVAARGVLDFGASGQSSALMPPLQGYDLTAALQALNLRTIFAKAPSTSITAQALVAGRGTELATLRAAVAADLSASRWDSIAVDTASVRASFANGLVDIHRLYARGASASASASGTFGLTANQTGLLTYSVTVDSLGALNRWIPKTPGLTKPVKLRPRVVAHAVARVRADSARAARASETERGVEVRAGARPATRVPTTLPADTLAGTLTTTGKIEGNIEQFDLTGHAAGSDVVARGNTVKSFKSVYAWIGARTPKARLAIGIEADTVVAMGFGFDSLSARFAYVAPGGGRIEAVVTQEGHRQYGAKGDYTIYPNRKELRLTDVLFRFDTVAWTLAHQTTLTWGSSGIRVMNFELTNRDDGRVLAHGLLPTSGSGDFTLDVENFPVASISDLVESNIDVTGVASLHAEMAGTLSSPRLRGTFDLVGGTYTKAKLPELVGQFGYADRRLVAHLDATVRRRSVMTVEGQLPINLALTGVTGDRLLPLPMSVDLVGDNLPIDLIPEFTDLVSNVHGRAAGRISVRGTIRDPKVVGNLHLEHAEATIVSSGATVSDMMGSVRLANDTVYVDSIVGKARGDVRLRGTLGVANWLEPTFNLHLTSTGAELLHNDYGKVNFNAGLALTGPFSSPNLSGTITVVQGVIYAPESGARHYLIGAGDPQLYNVLDTTVAAERDLFPQQSPFIQNLRIDVSLAVEHDTWVRNREANIEIYTDDPLTVHQEEGALALTGVITTDRGEYDFLSKRFQIKRGSAMFIGNADLNPTLQITGEYQVEVATRGALNIRVIVGGTLRKPTLTLQSDAQPPKTQSELLTLLAFGQSTTSLLASTSSSIAGTAATSDLFGAGAQLAVRRLEAAALGVAIQQIEIQAGRAFGTDVFDITAADVPTELTTGKGLNNFFTQTKIEAGKYVNPRTFVSGQFQAGQPGLAVEQRTSDGWRFSASTEPKVILREPTLTDQPYRVVRAFGGFIIREWRY